MAAILFLTQPVQILGMEASDIIFIREGQSFNLKNGTVVELGKGDINVMTYGIDAVRPKAEIAALHKGFIEDVKSLPEEEATDWGMFVDYETGMVYAVKCTDGNYGLFELVDVKVSVDRVIGIEVKYEYQPDGSTNFR